MIAFSYKMILTDWPIGKKSRECASIQKKCSVLRVTRSRLPVLHVYSLKGQILQAESHSKYLGVDLTACLSWNTHIYRIVKKGIACWGSCSGICELTTKASAYFTLVCRNLEYCSTVWSPYTSQAKHKMEMVLRRAARYATNRYRNSSSVTDMLENLNWETLETRQIKSQLTVMFKILHGLVDIPSDDYLTPASTQTRALHMKKLRQYASSTDAFKYSFFPRTITTWNSHHISVIVTVCRGPCALGIYSTHGTPSFMHPLWLQKRNSGCILPLS